MENTSVCGNDVVVPTLMGAIWYKCLSPYVIIGLWGGFADISANAVICCFDRRNIRFERM